MRFFTRLINKNPLFFAIFFPGLADGTLTLLGQGENYWASRIVNEASPAYYFLLSSPWLFIIGGMIWFIFWYWIFKRIKEPTNLFLMFLFIAGHSWGSSSWIMKIFKENNLYQTSNQLSIILAWSLLVIYFILIALFATYCLKIYIKKDR